MPDLQSNLETVRRRIAQAAGRAKRDPASVTLLAVTKTQSAERILPLQGMGVKVIGENRMQELETKYEALKGRFEIHFIGHLQTNKVKQVVSMADMIETVDSLKLGRAIQAECERRSRGVEVLVQVNTSGEDQKSGVRPEGLLPLLKELALLKRLRIRGLMTLAMLTEDRPRVRGCFRLLSELRRGAEQAGMALDHLSMGMSGDFDEAVEEGATLVRIGTALFGERG